MDICMSKFMDIVQFQKGTPRLTKRGILSIIFHLILFHCVYCCLCIFGCLFRSFGRCHNFLETSLDRT